MTPSTMTFTIQIPPTSSSPMVHLWADLNQTTGMPWEFMHCCCVCAALHMCPLNSSAKFHPFSRSSLHDQMLSCPISASWQDRSMTPRDQYRAVHELGSGM